ncbi:MAG: NAD-dependent epimerase/dehydratase family protein [Bacteroidota bacterium]|nr:NAD-dependent epimerase/dehydratase family protein [Bacteroidota bacterium]
MKNILITGGAGFIGSSLVYQLKKRGYNITILDNLSSQVHGDLDNSPSYQKVKDSSNFIKGDVREKKDWLKAIASQDAIIHLASETGTAQSMYEIEKYSSVNIIGTSNLLDVLTNQKHQIKKIVLASSRAIYGEGKYKCIHEGIVFPSLRNQKDIAKGRFNIFSKHTNEDLELLPTDEVSRIQPLSIYAITKQQQEQMIMLMGKALNISTVSLRYQNVYGPGQSLMNPYTGILSIFSTQILNGHDIEIYEDGQQSRDFVYIDDVVKATILALENTVADHHIFNVGSGAPTTVLKVAQELKQLYNSSININISGKHRVGDIRHNYADLAKITNMLEFDSENTFDIGIRKFTNWVLKQKVYEDKYPETLKLLSKRGLIK